MMQPISRLPPLPDEVYADPGRHGWYFREKKPDSVACYRRADLPPKVRALEWTPYFDGYCLHTETRIAAYSDAKGVAGSYSVGRKHKYAKSTKPKERAFDDHISSDWWTECPTRKLIGPFNSDILAKAAAQADYEARILAALVQP